MRRIVTGKWVVIGLWLAVIVSLSILTPNMKDLVREKGQITVPGGYSSTLADQIIQETSQQEGKADESQVALVFHRDEKLSSQDFAEAKKAIQLLESKKEELGITDITTHFNEETLTDKLVSKDGKTILAQISMKLNGREAKAVSDSLYQALGDVKLDHYYTSSWMIDEDLIANSQAGLKKTEGITVVFILAVLLLVFRSFITPFIPLVTVGMSYVVAQGIVAIMVDQANFPLSTFTQIFLVVVLFGIGTDYCILLLSRFKEELANQDSVTEAILTTYRTAGKTVFFSGLAVMVGFASIGMSTFKLYQSAAAVAIGVAVLLIALLTVVPFFMAVLGRRLFWPSKGKLEHHDSKLWGIVGKFSFARPIMALMIVAAVTVPFLLTYDADLSFNSLEEIGGDVPSAKAFNIISDSFSPGESMPTKIVIKNDERMDSAAYIGLLEKISRELEKTDQVKTVRSVTRPTGEKLKDLFVASQAGSLEKGLGAGNKGIQDISRGLRQAESKLSGSAPKLKEATTGMNELISGTKQLNTNMDQLQAGLTDIKQGLMQGATGTKQIKQGLQTVQANSEKITTGSKQLLSGYQKLATGLIDIEAKYKDVSSGVTGLSQSLTNVDQYFASLENDYSGLVNDANYKQLKSVTLSARQQSSELSQGLTAINQALSGMNDRVTNANQTFSALITGQQELNKAFDQLITGLEEQEKGITAAATGQGQMIDTLSGFKNGLTDLNNGQKQISGGFTSLTEQIDQLTEGLDKSVTGLNEVSTGLTSAQDYLTGLANDQGVAGFYIPEEALTSAEFKQALDSYMSKDRKVTTIDVVFDVNPYSNEAIRQIAELEQVVKQTTKGTKLENAQIAIGGVTSKYADLGTISKHDYARTVVLMLAGISLILIILFRSVVMPLYLIGSLILTYYTSMAMTEMIFVEILGYTGISWAVPFFGFVILVALGIDYSIFLMDRFNEYKGEPVESAMLAAMKKMGTVIISAVIILGGTFAAMLPSGVLSLLEIATIVLTGLILYALIILPLFVPVMVKIFGKANWWPFKHE